MTCIWGATLFIMAPVLRKNKLIKLHHLVQAGIGAEIYKRYGANDARTETMKRIVLKTVDGWDHDKVVKIVERNISELFTPLIILEAQERIAWHKEQGHIRVVVSSSPIELVAPVARLLGLDNVIATQITLDKDGRCTTEFDAWVFGPTKSVEVKRLAEELNIDLKASYAYSDSYLDRAFLESVGHPVAFNPDEELERHARENGWDIQHIEKPHRPAHEVNIPSWAKTAAGVGAGIATAAGTGFALYRKFATEAHAA